MAGRGRSLARPVAILVMVLLALPVGVAWGRTLGGATVVGHPGLSGFRQQAEVERSRYPAEDAVVVTYRVCRSRPWPTRTNSPAMGASLTAGFRAVNERGGVVADTSHRIYVLLLGSTHWWPGQCRSVDLEWDQHVWNQEQPDPAEQEYGGVPVRGDRVEPGIHRFEVWWEVSPGGEPDDRVPEPIATRPFVLAP
jgi:hypothetical protein